MIGDLERWSADVLVHFGPLVTAASAVAWSIVVCRMVVLRPRNAQERAWCLGALTVAWLLWWLLVPAIRWAPTDLVLALLILADSYWIVATLPAGQATRRREDIAATLRERRTRR